MASAADGDPVRRATSERGAGIPDLGRKVEHLKGILGYLFTNKDLEDRAIAETLKVSRPQWARKRQGALVTAAELGRLLHHFKLLSKRDHFDYTIFYAPYEDFVVTLHKAGAGIPKSNKREALNDLLSVADRRGHGVKLRHVQQRRGLGLGRAAAVDGTPTFAIGARVILEVEIAEPGFLLVLDDHYPAGLTRCLMPSLLRPVCRVLRGTVTIPAEGARPSVMTVEGLAGDCRIYAIWTREELNLAWMISAAEQLRALGQDEVVSLADAIRSRGQSGSYFIRTAEYRVSSGL